MSPTAGEQYRRLVHMLAPSKPVLVGDECAHPGKRKLFLCIGTSRAGRGRLDDAGRWYSRCWTGECGSNGKAHQWHTDQLSSFNKKTLLLQWAVDHPRSAIARNVRGPVDNTSDDPPSDPISESDDLIPDPAPPPAAFDLATFLSGAEHEFKAEGRNVVRILYWIHDGCTPISFICNSENIPRNPNSFNFNWDDITHLYDLIAGHYSGFSHWDVITGAWFDTVARGEFSRRRGEILCFKAKRVNDCPGLLQVRDYHQHIFFIQNTGLGLHLKPSSGQLGFRFDGFTTPSYQSDADDTDSLCSDTSDIFDLPPVNLRRAMSTRHSGSPSISYTPVRSQSNTSASNTRSARRALGLPNSSFHGSLVPVPPPIASGSTGAKRRRL